MQQTRNPIGRPARYVAKYGSTPLAVFALFVLFTHVPGESWIATTLDVGLDASLIFAAGCALFGAAQVALGIVDHYRKFQ